MPNKTSVYAIFKKTTRMYYYLMGLVLISLVVCSLVSNQVGPVIGQNPNIAYVLMVILFFIASLAMLSAFYFPSKTIKGLTAEMPLEKKLEAYKRAQFFRLAVFSATAILVSLFFLLTADSNILLIQAIILLFMIVYKPSPFKAKSDLRLTDEESNELFGAEKI